MDTILENRMKKVNKSTSNKDDMRRKTERNLLQLRKQQVDEYIMSKRKVINSDNYVYQINPLKLIIPEESLIDINLFLQNFNIHFLEEYLYSKEVNLMKYGLYILRKFIATDNEDVMKGLKLDVSLVNFICSLLDYPDNSVRFESSWILINLTNFSKSACEFISKEKNLIFFVDFLRYADELLIEHALWLIANISADSSFNRNFIVSSGILSNLAHLLNDFSTTDEIKEKTIWTICNLCRGKAYENGNEFLEIVNPVIKFISNTFDKKEIEESLYIIFKLTSSTGLILNKFINIEVYRKILDIMNKYDQNVRFYCIKIVANLLSGNDVQTQTFIQEGVIDLYKGLIEDTDIGIIKEVLWGISNICGGTVSQIEKVYESGVFNRVLELGNYLLPRADEDQIYYQCLRECAYCITNALSGGLNIFRIQVLQSETSNIIFMLVQFLQIFYKEKRLMETTLISIRAYLYIEEEQEMMDTGNTKISLQLIQNGFQELLGDLKTYPNEKVNEIVESILELIENMNINEEINNF